MDFNLSRVVNVAKKLNIDKTNSKVITVGGTNGKGSTVAILESILFETGYNVGSYTSPHLLHFNERIKINKSPARTKEICDAFEVIEKIRGEVTLTYFEFSTLAALIIFSKIKLDVIILEVGLGGRFDAVNIIDPDVSIITNIGLDHTDILGNDLEKIAYEKAGIMREGKPTIIGYSKAHKTIISQSEEIKSNLNRIDKDVAQAYEDDIKRDSFTEVFNGILNQVKLKLKDQRDFRCIEAIQQVFDNVENLDYLNKRAVFVYLREISGLNSTELSSSLSNIRKHYRKIVGTDIDFI